MGKNINRCTFEGNIGKEITARYMPNGKPVVNFSVACSNDYYDKTKEDWVNQTDWMECTAFDKIAEDITKKCAKGSSILVTDARYRKRPYQDKEGNTKYSHEFIINEWRLLEKQSSGQSAPAQQTPDADKFDDDIPF